MRDFHYNYIKNKNGDKEKLQKRSREYFINLSEDEKIKKRN